MLLSEFAQLKKGVWASSSVDNFESSFFLPADEGTHMGDGQTKKGVGGQKSGGISLPTGMALGAPK
jgi:hypothetical protein